MQHFLAIALRHWKPITLLNIVIMGLAAYNILTIEKTWTADAKLILPNTTRDLNLDLGEFGDLQEGEGLTFSPQLDSREILASIMTSTDAVRQAWEADPEWELYPRLELYKGLFTVRPDADSTAISLVTKGSTPEIARERLSLFIEAFYQRLDELRTDDVAQRTALIEQELAEVEQNLKRAGQSLVEFQEQTGLVDSDEQTQELIKAINTLSLAQGQVLAEFQANSLRLENLSNRLNQTPEQAVLALQLSEDQEYQAIELKLSELNIELLEAQTLFTDEHPQVAYLLAQRAELLENQQAYIVQSTAGLPGVNTSVGQTYAALIQELVLTESATYALQQQGTQLATQLEQLNTRLAAIPSAQVRLQALRREYDLAQEVYNSLIAQIEANRVDAFSTYPIVQVLDQPTASTRPSGPGRRPIAAGALIASVLGSAAIALYREQQNPLLTPADLDDANLPLLGKIPTFPKLNPGQLEPFTSALAFQQLAAVVSKTLPTSECLMVSSAVAAEGKTTVALGLAIALSQLSFKVLLIDGGTDEGLQAWHSGASLKSTHHLNVATVAIRPGLEVAAIEPQFSSDQTHSTFAAFEKLLHTAQHTQQYDYVLIDSAPITTSREANWLMAKVAALLLVMRPGHSYRHPFQASLEHLAKTQVQVLGLVVNG
ncbi:MAG: GNVR domain-containing protein [Cyanobacteria bacterium J06639_14]